MVYELVKGASGYTQQTLFSFAANSTGNATGANPFAGLTIDAQGNLYGTTQFGGAHDTGVVFRVSNSSPVAPIQSASQTAADPTSSNPTPTNPTPPANNAPCYCTGTRILTERGPVAVEDLAIGDRVVTAAGAHRPIRWIGTRSYGGRFANTNPAILPVCVKAGALAEAVPVHDLWVSPEHALFLDGVLVPAEQLVNGVTIVKAERVETVTYWHIELDSHDVLLAEDAPAESFVDDGGRAIFHNAATYRALYPHVPAWMGKAAYCAPRVTEGFALEAIRRRLALRAGLPVAPARTFGALRGQLDLCAVVTDGTLRVAGWAWDLAYPDGPVCLDVVVDGAVVGLAYAEAYRADLAASGIGDGCHGFDVTLTLRGLSGASTVALRRSADGAMLAPRIWPRRSGLLPDPTGRAAAVALRGHVDHLSRRQVIGWARDAAAPDSTVALVVLADGRAVGRCLADRPRDDLVAAGEGHGRHGFDFAFPRWRLADAGPLHSFRAP